MNERFLIRASGVRYAPESDLAVGVIEIFHDVRVQTVLSDLLQVLELLINVRHGRKGMRMYKVNPDGKDDIIDGTKAGID